MMPLDRIVAIALAVTVMTAPASADEPVRLLAAGSLRSALTEVTSAFEAAPASGSSRSTGPPGR